MTISVRKVAVLAALVAAIVSRTTHSQEHTPDDECALERGASLIHVVLSGDDDPGGWAEEMKFRAAKSSDFKNSTDYFRDLAVRRMSQPTFTIFGGAGVPTCTSTNPADFGPENNAWCLIADQDQVTNYYYPMFFTRNAVQTSADGRTNWVLADVEPLGTNMCMCLTQGGAILRLQEKDVQSWSTNYPVMTILRP